MTTVRPIASRMSRSVLQSLAAPRLTNVRQYSAVVRQQISRSRNPEAVSYAVLRPSARSMVMVSQHKKGETAAAVNVTETQSSPQVSSTPYTPASDAPLIVTESTWNRIRLLNEKKGADQYLRVFVDAGGCSGFSYVFELNQDEIDPDEDTILVGPTGERVVVDEASLNLIRGSTIDYVQEMIKSSFEVRENPQSESACGCGSSFAVKNFTANPALD